MSNMEELKAGVNAAKKEYERVRRTGLGTSYTEDLLYTALTRLANAFDEERPLIDAMMDRVDHRTELPGERPWMLPITTQYINQVSITDLHSVRHRRDKHCSNYPFCTVDPNQNESIPPNVKLNLRHAHGRSHFYSSACIQLGCIDLVDPGEGVSPDESEEA